MGIAMVQDITRPLGIPIQHSSIPFQNSMQGQTNNQNLPFMRGSLANMLKMPDEMQFTIDNMQRLYAFMQQLAATTHAIWPVTRRTDGDTDELRDHIADFDDFFRPIRNYFYWEPHCFDIPICWSLRSIYSTPSTASMGSPRHRHAHRQRRWTHGYAHAADARADTADDQTA